MNLETLNKKGMSLKTNAKLYYLGPSRIKDASVNGNFRVPLKTS